MLPSDAPSSGLMALRVAEHLHGHLGWLAAAALVHPAVILRKAERRAHLAVGLGVGIATTAAVMGMALYPSYREQLKPTIFADATSVGLAFERKEHLAFGAIMMAWAGASAYVASRLAAAGAAAPLRRASHACFVVAALFAVVTAVLGTCVAAYRTF